MIFNLFKKYLCIVRIPYFWHKQKKKIWVLYTSINDNKRRCKNSLYSAMESISRILIHTFSGDPMWMATVSIFFMRSDFVNLSVFISTNQLGTCLLHYLNMSLKIIPALVWDRFRKFQISKSKTMNQPCSKRHTYTLKYSHKSRHTPWSIVYSRPHEHKRHFFFETK